MYQILTSSEYKVWFEEQSFKTQAQIMARLERISDSGHFGDAKHLGSKLAELKWKNGLRIYFSLAHDEIGRVILILIAGNKNSQKKDISLARKILSKLLFKDQ
jgi:putative addiction module killer protein